MGKDRRDLKRKKTGESGGKSKFGKSDGKDSEESKVPRGKEEKTTEIPGPTGTTENATNENSSNNNQSKDYVQ